MRSTQRAIALARGLRKNQTKAEKILWQRLRNKQMMGYRFLRQRPVYYKNDNKYKFFVADFFCFKLRLIIEVDGGIHQTQEDYDQKRTELLQSKNFVVLRFSNEEIEMNVTPVTNKIRDFIKNLTMKHNSD